MIHGLRNISHDHESLYISLLKKQHKYIQEIRSKQDISPYKKIIVQPSEIFQNQDSRSNSKYNSRASRFLSKRSNHEISRTVSPRCDSTNTSKGNLASRAHLRINIKNKKSLLNLILDSGSQAQSQSPLRSYKLLDKYKHDLSYVSACTPTRKIDTCNIYQAPKRYRIIRSKFESGDNSWLFENKTVEDRLRTDNENLVQDVMKRAVTEFELEADKYGKPRRLVR